MTKKKMFLVGMLVSFAIWIGFILPLPNSYKEGLYHISMLLNLAALVVVLTTNFGIASSSFIEAGHGQSKRYMLWGAASSGYLLVLFLFIAIYLLFSG